MSDEMFRLDACLKKMLGKPLTEAERDVIRDVNRIQGWDSASAIEARRAETPSGSVADESAAPQEDAHD